MTSQSRYSGISTINHWITALLVVVMFTLAFAASRASEEAAEDYLMEIHIGLGFFVFLFILWRAAWRLYEGFPHNHGLTPWESWLAWVVHRGLLVMLVIQVFTGPLYLFTEDDGINVFGWFTVAIPLEGSLEIIHEPMEAIHVYTGLYIIPALFLLHFVGAIRYFLTKDKSETPADL